MLIPCFIIIVLDFWWWQREHRNNCWGGWNEFQIVISFKRKHKQLILLLGQVLQFSQQSRYSFLKNVSDQIRIKLITQSILYQPGYAVVNHSNHKTGKLSVSLAACGGADTHIATWMRNLEPLFMLASTLNLIAWTLYSLGDLYQYRQGQI